LSEFIQIQQQLRSSN